jgi:hypothetical protein
MPASPQVPQPPERDPRLVELLDRLAHERQVLEAALEPFEGAGMEMQLMDSHWRVKDLLAHLEFWEGRVTRRLEALQRGETGETTIAAGDFDTLNAMAYDAFRHRDADEIRQTERRVYEHLVEVVAASPAADLFSPNRFEWAGGVPFVELIVGNTWEHWQEHEAQLARLHA